MLTVLRGVGHAQAGTSGQSFDAAPASGELLNELDHPVFVAERLGDRQAPPERCRWQFGLT